jgi:hypothetical protein
MVRLNERDLGTSEAGKASARMRRELARLLRAAQSAAKGKTHPLWNELESGRFPPQPGPRPVSLESLDLGS